MGGFRHRDARRLSPGLLSLLLLCPGAWAARAAAADPPDAVSSAGGRVAAITELSLAGRVVEPDDPAPPGVQASTRDGTVIGLEAGLLLPSRGRLAWGATLAAHGGRGYSWASARLRCRWRVGHGARYLALSPGLGFGGGHEYRSFTGTGLVCGLDYGFSPPWSLSLQFARLPVTPEPPRALTSLDLGLKLGGRAGLIGGSVWIAACAVTLLAISALVRSLDWQ